MCEEMTRWSDLPEEVVKLIAERLKKVENFVAFGRDCSREYFKGIWLRQRQAPYLMLPGRFGEDNTREFYSLYEGEIVASVTALKFICTRCLESLGCLLLTQERGHMFLFDPFSDIQIPLPRQNRIPGYSIPPRGLRPHVYVQKMVLSSRPSETSDFTVMIICGRYSSLAFWRPGDEAWNNVDIRGGCFSDITYHKGYFYAINDGGYVWVLNLERNNQQVQGRILTRLLDDGLNNFPTELTKRPVPKKEIVERMKTLYILGTDHGSLLVIARTSKKWNEEENRPYNSTSKFQVYEVDVQTGLWRKIHSLGTMAIFIGQNSTVYVHASTSHSPIKPNHIYFTDDGWRSYVYHRGKEGGKDMGVYDLETEKIEQFYHGELRLSIISPAIWITPRF